ncbi:hypothetical protein L5G32_14425 [Gordonia sp. HY002]|uniref:hypothetical protein n=1 Tax=Gordonia zhenghanii TaxID=2911516 RepID=UPI001EF041D8|nr:hypothetical protein [Gordonia zhenghanii]MCF8571465.1 hypothetical protein [Gordonia zhenghanii]MCF8606649.1 hypothetical protein [Gordonia zhenghanii]
MNVADRIELAVLTGCGVVLALLTVFFLNVRIGAVPVPFTVVIAAIGTTLLLRLAAGTTSSSWRYAPLVAWTAVVVIAAVPGINGNGPLIGDWRVLLLLLCGLGLPAMATSMSRLNNL